MKLSLQQLDFEIPKHGGARRGAGRKKRLAGQPNHVKRPKVSGKVPLNITLKLQPGLRCMRSISNLRAFARAMRGSARLGLRILQFSLRSNHLHLIAEAEDNQALQRGMKSLTVSLAHAINRVRLIGGKVFWGRFHLHALKSPTEMRRALHYVIFNYSKHLGIEKCMDPFSSVFGFEGLEALVGDAFRKLRIDRQPHWTVKGDPAKSWLASEG